MHRWQRKGAKGLLILLLFLIIAACGVFIICSIPALDGSFSQASFSPPAVTTDQSLSTPERSAEPPQSSEGVEIPTPAASAVPAVGAGQWLLDVEQAEQGYVYAAFSSSKRAKFSLYRDGEPVHHDLMNDGSIQRFSLSMGSGNYEAVIYENVEGTSYRKIAAVPFEVTLVNANSPFLVSNNVVRYQEDMECIVLAHQLVSNKGSQRDKARALYDWVVSHVSYNYDLLGKLESGYVSDINHTYSTGKGICYDFSILYAAMCRSQDIPCKVVSGYADGVEGYHAWNEVFFDEVYHIVDTSTDAQLAEALFVRDEGYEAVRYD